MSISFFLLTFNLSSTACHSAHKFHRHRFREGDPHQRRLFGIYLAIPSHKLTFFSFSLTRPFSDFDSNYLNEKAKYHALRALPVPQIEARLKSAAIV
jgi:hypothetical protein